MEINNIKTLNQSSKKLGRISKSDKYKDQQLIILRKIFKILNLSLTNKIFNLHDIDNDIEKQNQIIELKAEISMYFNACKWRIFRNDVLIVREYMSIIRNVFKDLKVDFLYYVSKIKNINKNKFHNETIYMINNIELFM